MELKQGQIVRSKVGRDKGRYFLVLGWTEDMQYAHLADGMLRKVENPKKKKWKHIEETRVYSAKIASKLVEGKSIQNSEIAKELKQLAEGRTGE